MSMRELKHHEKRLLRKVDFMDWKTDRNMREVAILRQYHVEKREDYAKYNKICGHITKLAHELKDLEPSDPFRITMTEKLLDKLYAMGLISTKKSLEVCERIAVSAFCRRRLPVVMVRLKMAESIREANRFVEQAHIRVGPEVVTDPAFLVTRAMEDYVTWVDQSRIKRAVMRYNDQLDDYDLLGN